MGIHKYGPDTSSCQLGIKTLGTRVPRADGYGSRSLDSLSSGVAVCISERKYVVTDECLKHSYYTRVRFMFLVDFTFK